MKRNNNKSKKFLIISLSFLLSLCAIVYGYVNVAKVGAAGDGLVSTGSTNDDTTNPLTPVEMTMLAKIESITLDGSIFSDQIFASTLQDWSVSLGQVSAGKPNPFLPLNGFLQNTTIKNPKTPVSTKKQ